MATITVTDASPNQEQPQCFKKELGHKPSMWRQTLCSYWSCHATAKDPPLPSRRSSLGQWLTLFQYIDLFSLPEILSPILSFSLAIWKNQRGHSEICHEQIIHSRDKKTDFIMMLEINIYQVTAGYFFSVHLEEPWVSIILKTTFWLLPSQLTSDAQKTQLPFAQTFIYFL